MDHLRKKLGENLSRVKGEIGLAWTRAGRDNSRVTLIAVTKSVGPEVIRALLELGQVDLGENRPQQLLKRATMLDELARRARQANPRSRERGAKFPAARWHMVGHLQRNKVSMVLNFSKIIHSVNTLRLAEEINSRAAKRDMRVDVLMEVNCSGESSKHGISPAAVNHLAEQFETFKNMRLIGLMTMGPLVSKAEQARGAFVRLRELLEELHRDRYVGKECVHLSMGTSQDYTVAIEEGATMVRLGRALFQGVQLSC